MASCDVMGRSQEPREGRLNRPRTRRRPRPRFGYLCPQRAKPPISTTEALGGHTSNLHAKTLEDEDDDEYEDDLGGGAAPSAFCHSAAVAGVCVNLTSLACGPKPANAATATPIRPLIIAMEMP